MVHEVTTKLSKEESLERVKFLVNEAADILRTLSEEHARLGWVLEDALVYLDEVEQTAPLASLESDAYCESSNVLKKAVNIDSL